MPAVISSMHDRAVVQLQKEKKFTSAPTLKRSWQLSNALTSDDTPSTLTAR